jgi:hypothetical protein
MEDEIVQEEIFSKELDAYRRLYSQLAERDVVFKSEASTVLSIGGGTDILKPWESTHFKRLVIIDWMFNVGTHPGSIERGVDEVIGEISEMGGTEVNSNFVREDIDNLSDDELDKVWSWDIGFKLNGVEKVVSIYGGNAMDMISQDGELIVDGRDGRKIEGLQADATIVFTPFPVPVTETAEFKSLLDSRYLEHTIGGISDGKFFLADFSGGGVDEDFYSRNRMELVGGKVETGRPYALQKQTDR